MDEPNRARCSNCGLVFDLDPSNTVVYHYTCQPWFSWQQIICPQCELVNGLFIVGNFDWEMRYCIAAEIGFITEEFAPQAVVDSYTKFYKIVPLEEKDLSGFEEKEVMFWAWLLNRDGVSGFLPMEP